MPTGRGGHVKIGDAGRDKDPSEKRESSFVVKVWGARTYEVHDDGTVYWRRPRKKLPTGAKDQEGRNIVKARWELRRVRDRFLIELLKRQDPIDEPGREAEPAGEAD